MKLTQSWVGYLDRSYEQVKKSCLKRLGITAPELSDHSESNPLIIILSQFSGIAEMLNLYVDSKAREAFLGTCRRYASAVKLVKLIDYNIKARNPASVDLFFSLVDELGNPINATSTVTIPVNTGITSPSSNMVFRLLKEAVINIGGQNVYGIAAQFDTITDEVLGSTTGEPLQKISLSPKYVNASLRVRVNGEEWLEYRSFGLMAADSKGYVVNIDEDKNAFMQFGDGINGMIPTVSQIVLGDYRECEGVAGNVPPDSLTTISSTIPVPLGTTLMVTNNDYASGGTDFESLEDIKNRAPRSLRTLERAVTYQDYLDLPLLVPGVGASAARYCCGKYVDIFIAPSSKGVATRALVAIVNEYMQCKVMITTVIDVQPSGLTRVWIKAKIFGKPLYSAAEIYSQVVDELDAQFGFDKIEINRRISITDIISTVEKLSKVDTIEIEKVKVEPYARPLDATENILNIQWLALPTTNTKYTYKLVFRIATGQFELYKNTYFIQQLVIALNYNDGIIGFKILAGTYADGDSWEFSAFPSYPEIFPTTTIQINDYSAAIVDVGPTTTDNTPRTIFSEFEIISQGTSSSCLPEC